MKRWKMVMPITLSALTLLVAQSRPLIHRERAVNLFVRLVQIDSGALNEGKIARFVAGVLRELGAQFVEIDDASKKLGGTGGNVFARFKGTVDAPAVLLSAHLDTVSSTKGIRLIRTKDFIMTDGTTILGADDKAGVALILEVLQTLREKRLPHPPLEVVLTIREEKGLLGAKVFDKGKLTARYGLIVDGAGEPNELIIGSPMHVQFEVIFRGKPAHAGVEPEKGISAIVMAAKAIAASPWGRLDEETTANVGVIKGGEAMNIVAPECRLIGEVRSHDPQKVEDFLRRWRKACQKVAGEMGGMVKVKTKVTFHPIRLSPDEPIVKVAVEALQEMGMTPKLVRIGGGTDGNVFTAHGIPCLVLPTGGEHIHSNRERLNLKNFYLCGELLVRLLIKLAGR